MRRTMVTFCILLSGLVQAAPGPLDSVLHLNPNQSESQQQAQVGSAVFGLCESKNVGNLEWLSSVYRKNKTKFSDGTSALVKLYNDVAEYPDVVELWRRRNPKSVTPIVCSISIHIHKAWGFKPDSKDFERELSLAEGDCAAAMKLDKSDVGIYYFWLTMGVTPARAKEVLKYAQAADPAFVEIYRLLAPTLVASKGGSAKIRQMIEESSKITNPVLGRDSLYALVSITLASDPEGSVKKLAEQLGGLDKARLIRGAESLSKRFPRGSQYPSWLLKFCLYQPNAADRAYLAKAYAQYKGHLNEQIVSRRDIEDALK